MAKKDPFEQHGIRHLSPSSINTFAAQPAYWALKYLMKHKDEGNARMWRGSAVEAGLDHWLLRNDEQEASLIACHNRFELEALGLADDLTEKERGDLPNFLRNAVEGMTEGGFEGNPPTTRQLKVEFWFDGIEVPMIGYTDYEWEDQGTDLKTTRRMPSVIPAGHSRQISFYSAARKKPFNLLYATPKKFGFLEQSTLEFQTSLKQLEWYSNMIRGALAVSDDPEVITRLYPPDFSSFYWSDSETRDKAREVWK